MLVAVRAALIFAPLCGGIALFATLSPGIAAIATLAGGMVAGAFFGLTAHFARTDGTERTDGREG